MAKLLPRSCIAIVLLSSFFNLHCLSSSSSPLVGALNLTLPHQHPYPEVIVEEFHRRVNVSLTRRQTLELSRENDHISCVTGNPIDDCWRCDPNWANNRQQLADCAIGFGQNAFGGKGGPIYVVTSSSDPDKPRPGTLRDAASQPGPVWIVFSGIMVIKLKRPLMVTSFKTIDGRGAHVEITGGGCISIEHMTNVIIHNINIHSCYPSNSDGDGLHIFASSNIWVDHCSLSNCADGLIDCTEASTAITISNCYFSHHDKVMLLGHSDEYSADRGMQITVAFNRFGEKLVQRMPRCRFGYFHVVNNDYTTWGEYAVGGSSHPTVNSQGNRYIAPINRYAKEVTKRLDTKGSEWKRWNWRSEGDEMVNGAFFVTSGGGVAQYSLASSVEPKSAAYIDQLTLNAGVLLANGGIGVYMANPRSTSAGISSGDGLFPGGSYSPPELGGEDGGSFGGGGGLIFSNAPPPPQPYQITFIIFSTLIIFTFISPEVITTLFCSVHFL